MEQQNRGWEITQAEPFKGKTVQDFLYFEGMYNPAIRFAFTNVLSEDFVSFWNSRRYSVKPHQTVKLQHHLAVKFTKELVDRLMVQDKKEKMMGVPNARKEYEDKVLTLMPQTEDDMELQVIKDNFADEVRRDTEKQVGVREEELAFPALNVDDLSPKNFGQIEYQDDPSHALAQDTTKMEQVAPIVPPKKIGRPRKQI